MVICTFSMITVNSKKTDYKEGLTVRALLEQMKFVFPMLVIKINGKLVDRNRYDSTSVADGDKVDIVHLISGG